MPMTTTVHLVAAVARTRRARTWSAPAALTAGIAFALLATPVRAQAPAAPAAPAATLRLEPLATALRGDVHTLHNLQTGVPRAGSAAQDPPPRGEGEAGSKAARPFATIRDARFDGDGRLLALLVEPTAGDRRAEPGVRVLPAAQIEWDEDRRRWLVREANLKFAELAPTTGPRPAAPSPPTVRPAADTWLASHLVQATFDPLAFTPPAKPTDGRPAANAAAATAVHGSFWLAPKLQRLALVVVPVPGRSPDGQPATQCFVVPWALLHLTSAAGGLAMRIGSTPASLAAGPTCEQLATEPDHALRQRCYAHFQIAAPSWDPATTAGAANTK